MPTKLHPTRAVRELGRSFVFAFAGLIYTLHSQRNMRFHIFFAIFAMAFYVTFDVPFEERGLLLIAICLVPAFEIINTSIESITDYVASERHVLVKHAKDTAAAAVLVMALLSMAMGGYVLLPRFIDYFKEPSTAELTATGVRFVLACLVLGSLLTFWLLRSLRYLFKPLLAVASLVGGIGSMALCLCGRDPSAFVAMIFLVVIELNAFARLAFEMRIEKAWERKNLPFDTAGFRIIIPYAIIGTIIGAYLAYGVLRPFWR
ncbi:MAG: diacylglycerol kinase family protein [Candidatus Lernaella stagnicola]|nr:diacylglycerol kinase family protein [Candidatus Lernaella stagnicola]